MRYEWVACGAARPRSWQRVSLAASLVVVVVLFAAGCGLSSDPSAVATREAVVLLPPLNAGEAGWCLLTLGQAAEGGCPATRVGHPIIAESLETRSPPAEAMGVDLTSSYVSAVSIDGGMSLPTRAERALPENLRAVVWVMPGETPHSAGFPPRPTPLDTYGHVMRQTSYGTARNIRGGLLVEVPSRTVENPADPPLGPCVIKAARVPGLTVQSAFVVSTVKAVGGLIGEALLACATTEYALAKWLMGASILVDAARPGVTPPPLPLMKPVVGHPNIFEEPGQLGPQVARRIRGGWLVVWGGKNRVERQMLVEHLRASGPSERRALRGRGQLARAG